MTEADPMTFPSDADVTNAQREYDAAHTFLNDPTQPIADLRGERRAAVDKLVRADAVLQRARARPLPTSGPPGPSQAARDAAALRNHAYLSEIRQFPEGSAAAKARIRQFEADTAIVNTPGPLVETNLTFDVRQPALPTLPPPPVEIPMELPTLARGEHWPIAELEEGERAYEAAGLGLSYLPLLHLIRHAHDEGGGWTAERALEQVTRRYGAERAQELAQRADAFDRAVLQHAPKFRAWLERKGLLYVPEVIEYALAAWERAGGGSGSR